MWRALALVIFVALTGPVGAQNVTPVLTLNQEELFLQSQFGQRIRSDIAASSAELAAENREIEAALMAEEQALTAERANLPVDEFREKAQAFDEKVTSIRTEQDAKGRAIGRKNDEAQQVFFSRVATVLLTIMQERGALAILDERMVFLSVDSIDITDLAIARIDAAIGDGTGQQP
ncbi:OmpH family outer membrane protein [Oceaniglobus ichthyenteri]|uniref:OmpH family outer membrane protein n=1 Tax=Oceaniglobus ichthyenteri TaxID=2136177 RepID=UPI000D3D5920|nr:OmpH family outer membrane protein [Oceaniglobus ichthyenteri]